jgi:hypothetical protein
VRDCLMGTEFLFGIMKIFSQWIMLVVAHGVIRLTPLNYILKMLKMILCYAYFTTIKI